MCKRRRHKAKRRLSMSEPAAKRARVVGVNDEKKSTIGVAGQAERTFQHFLSAKIPKSVLPALLPFLTLKEIRRTASTSTATFGLYDVKSVCLANVDRSFCATKEGVETLLNTCNRNALRDITLHDVIDTLPDKRWLPKLPGLRELLVTETLFHYPRREPAPVRQAISLAELKHITDENKHFDSLVVRFAGGGRGTEPGATSKQFAPVDIDFRLLSTDTVVAWLKTRTSLRELGLVNSDAMFEGTNLSPMLEVMETWPVRQRPTRLEITRSSGDLSSAVRVLPYLQSLRVWSHLERTWDWGMPHAEWTKTWSATLTELQLLGNCDGTVILSDLGDVAEPLARLTRLRVLQLDAHGSLADCIKHVGPLRELERLSVGIDWATSTRADEWKQLHGCWPNLQVVDWTSWNNHTDFDDDKFIAPISTVHNMVEFAQRHPNLHSMRWALDLDGASEKEVTQLAHLPLSHLRVYFAQTADQLIEIIQTQKNLEQLVIDHCHDVPSRLFSAFALPEIKTESSSQPSRPKRPLRVLRMVNNEDEIDLSSANDMKTFALACPDMRVFVCDTDNVVFNEAGVQHWLETWHALELLHIDMHVADEHQLLVRCLAVEKRLRAENRTTRFICASSSRAFRKFDDAVDKDEYPRATDCRNFMFDLWL